MPEDNKELDGAFAEAIRKHPLEARSHFEIVDPLVWKIFPAGKGNISVIQRYWWSGPFRFSVSGQEFEAFGRKGKCEISQKMFLEEWGFADSPRKTSASTSKASASTNKKSASTNAIKFALFGIGAGISIIIIIALLTNGNGGAATNRSIAKSRNAVVNTPKISSQDANPRSAQIEKEEKARKIEQEQKARIESENAVELDNVRKTEAARRALEEKKRSEKLARKRFEEEKRKKELKLKKQGEARVAAEEKERKIAAENERKRLEIERRKAEEERALEEARQKRLEEENRKRQIEFEREAALRKAEEEKQRKLEEEKKERERQELARREQERIAEEAKAQKLEADRANAANLLSRLVSTLCEGVAGQSKELVDELRPNIKFLTPDSKKLFDEACAGCSLLCDADSGDGNAMMKLAQSYDSGTSIFKSDHSSAYRWYLKAADGGDPQAQYKVGEMLVLGDGVAENAPLACSYFLKSAENNNPQAQFMVAEMYRIGKGVEKDGKKANQWYKRGAELGNSDCQFAWSKRLEKGDGMFFSDKKAAFEWLYKAASSGHGEACYLIGCQYYNGSDNLKSSIIKAYKMFKRAKDAGFMNKDLQHKLNVCEKIIMEKAAALGL